MSRGHGNKQKAILDFLHSAEGPVTVEAMRWSLYEAKNGPTLTGKLPASWNTALSRAAKLLEADGSVAITPRRLKSFEECAEHYPHKTLNAEKRKLRRRILPALLQWILASDGVAPRYGEADNEKFHLQQLSETTVSTLGQRWWKIEQSLRPLFGRADSSDDLLRLLCKGRSLFRLSDIEVRSSLTSAINFVCRKQLVPEPLSDELQNFKQDFLSNQDAGSLRLKSLIHNIAEIPRLRQCTLREETLQYLHKHDRAFVESLPGFREKETPFKVTWFGGGTKKDFEYPSELVSIFDQTVFQEFDFITRVS